MRSSITLMVTLLSASHQPCKPGAEQRNEPACRPDSGAEMAVEKAPGKNMAKHG